MRRFSQHNILQFTLFASVSGLTWASPATDEPKTYVLEEVNVLGKAYKNTATKSSLAPEETPQGISIIDGELLAERGVKSLNQALRYTPGVTTEQKGGSVTMYDTFNIRGFDVSQSYYDGLVLQYLQGWNLQPQIDPIALEQVEVYKGPTSVLYGSMPPGGMVNMIAKAPQQEQQTTATLATGSHNTREASIDSTGALGDSDASYRVIAMTRKKDGQVDYTEEERTVFAPSVDWSITDKTYVNINLYYQKDPAMGQNSSLPASGMIDHNPAGSTKPSTFAGDANWNHFEREFWMAGYKVRHDFNDNWSFLQTARYQDATLEQRNTYHIAAGFDASTGNLERYIYSTDEDSKGYSVDNQLSGAFKTGEIEHNTLVGVDYQQLKGQTVYSSYGSTSQFGNFNIYNPNNHMIDPSKLSTEGTWIDDVEVEQTGLYVQDQLHIDNWVLIAGGRFDDYHSSSKFYDAEANHQEFSYRVGALYEFDNGLSPFISYATSFEPYASGKSDGTPYKPELGEQIETGVKYLSDDETTSATVSYFNIIKSDAVVDNPDDPTPGNKLQIGEIQSQGLEIEGQLLVTPNWGLSASYTYIDMKITKDTDYDLQGTTPIYVPEHAATLWTNYTVDRGLLNGTRIGGGVRYTGEMQMDAVNSDRVPASTIVDASVGYDLAQLGRRFDGATVNLVVNNLFNQESYTCYDSANCWYGAERTVEVNAQYQF
ncbi:iron complex outermembrane receptor protein [Sinobacterium caligoides]|uniref:Iron complex outermembrane receptor protein n=2 Tax=Sinobacterium caligoides TaxID=933926 RepID=A0A3N2DK45_9GAMM|nr:iron complex outermembrane receptor protein [Sinobacterium caligoides]